MGSLRVQERICVTFTGLSDICSNRSMTSGGVGVMEGVYALAEILGGRGGLEPPTLQIGGGDGPLTLQRR